MVPIRSLPDHDRRGGGNGNYVLKCLSGKNKGKINKSSYPPNHLKKYVIRNSDIPSSGNTSESEYGSKSENEAEEASSTNDDAVEIPVHTPMDSDETLPDLTVDELPVPPHVLTPSDEPPTPLHICTPSMPFPGGTPSSSIPPISSDETMTAAHILAELALTSA